MTHTILTALVIGLFNAFVITTMKRTGLTDFLNIHTWYFLPWGCDFCLNFWFSVVAVAILALIALPLHWTLLLIVIMATVIGRHFTK